jgi:hypothetical protein
MTVCKTELPFDFPQPHLLDVQFSDLELSTDAGLLLVRQADERLGLTAAIASGIEEWRDPAKVTHSLEQLVQQRVYQIIGGYEDANDSNDLRHDPIYKIACGRGEPVSESADDNPTRESRGAILDRFEGNILTGLSSAIRRPPRR